MLDWHAGPASTMRTVTVDLSKVRVQLAEERMPQFYPAAVERVGKVMSKVFDAMVMEAMLGGRAPAPVTSTSLETIGTAPPVLRRRQSGYDRRLIFCPLAQWSQSIALRR